MQVWESISQPRLSVAHYATRAVPVSVFLITHNCGSITHRFWCPVSRSIRHLRQSLECKLSLLNHIPVHSADWFKYHFQQLYFKADWSKIHFLFTLSLPFNTFVFTLDENMSLLTGLHVWRCTLQQSLVTILSLRERDRDREKEILKQLKKILVQP